MRYIILLVVLVLTAPGLALAGEMDDDPLRTMVIVDQLEVRFTGGRDPLAWDADAWIGKDIDKLWIKTEGEYISSRMEEVELQALYSRAVAPFWDLQIGWRGDLRPAPKRNWLAFGVRGLAPYFFDIDAAVFIGTGGRTAARLQAEYEIMLTQRLVLVPDIEFNLYGKDDRATGTGSGLSDIQAGLRLRYEIRRELAPYIGMDWKRLYGGTADDAREEGSDVEDLRLVIGLRIWF